MQVALVSSIYMAGMLAGSFVGGYLSDKIGRVWAMWLLTLVTCTSGMCGAWVNKYEQSNTVDEKFLKIVGCLRYLLLGMSGTV